MDSRPNPKRSLKTSFRPTHLIPPLHTQGPVILTPDGNRVITTTGEEVLLTDVKTGRRLGRIHSDTSEITSMALSPSGVLAVFTRSLALRYYTIPEQSPDSASDDFLPLDPSSSSAGSSSSALSSTAVPLLPLLRHTPRSHPAPILVSVMDPTSTLLASGSADGIVKVWDLAGGFVTHLFRSHGGPVSSLCFNIPREGPAKGKRMELITGSGDTRVRVFDLKDSNAGGKPRAVLEGHVSVVRGLGASPDGRWLVSGGRDKVVLVWDLWGGLEDGWERLSAKKEGGAKKGKGKAVEVQLVRTMTVLESLESVGVLATGETVEGVSNGEAGALLCWTGGEKGVVRVWDVRRGTELASLKGAAGVDVSDEQDDGEDQRGIVEVQYNPATSTLLSVHSDQNILFHSLKTSLVSRQLVGYNDEIIDSIFLSPSSSSSSSTNPRDSYLALATNSSLIRVYSTSTFDARLLPGHNDMVLCLDRSQGGDWLVSGSKDRTARVWAFSPSEQAESGGGEWKCLAICEGHAESVGAVAVSRRAIPNDSSPSSSVKAKFIFTASQDRTIKMWDLNAIDLDSDEPAKPKSLLTQKIHEKDINSLDLSPNDRFLASGSQDKLVKVFEVSYSATSKTGGQAVGSVNLVGTCKGHKRGVWSVKFSKTDRVLATGSGDKTVKIWSLDDFSCLKTFEGHSNSVLRVDFLSLGQQLISSSSDGLVKLWNVKDEECVASLDNHEDKIWALAVSEDEKTIVSGAADSMVTFWGDCTETDEKEKVAKLEKSVMNEQNFANYVTLKDYRNAILLALAMSQPGRLLSLFTSVRSNRPPPPLSASLLDVSASPSASASTEELDAASITGSAAVDQVIKTLPGLDLVRLMGHVRDWNARAKTSPVAQTILHAILRLRTADEIVKAFEQSTTVAQAAKDAALLAAENEEENGTAANDKSKKRGGQKKASAGVGLGGLGEILDAMVPYTERHFERAERMVQESFVLDFALSEMDGGLFGFEFDGGVDEEEDDGEDVQME